MSKAKKKRKHKMERRKMELLQKGISEDIPWHIFHMFLPEGSINKKYFNKPLPSTFE
jgi:hypothetical protein